MSLDSRTEVRIQVRGETTVSGLRLASRTEMSTTDIGLQSVFETQVPEWTEAKSRDLNVNLRYKSETETIAVGLSLMGCITV